MGVTHRLLHFVKQGIRRLDWGLLALLIGVSAFDIGLQYWSLHDFRRIVVVVVKSVCAGMALCVPAFLLGRKARWFYLPLWCWLCFIEMVECVSFWKFMRPLDGDWLMIVLTSSWEEMASFGKELGVGCVILSLLTCLVLMVAGGRWLWVRRTDAWNGRRALMGLSLLMPMLLLGWLNPSGCGALASMMYYYFLEDTVCNYREYADVAQTARAPILPDMRIDVPKGIVPLGVVVVGESAARSHLHAYGYGRKTTPCLDSLSHDLIVFRDVRTVLTYTGGSLKMFFTEATTENPGATRSTLAQRYAKAGYSCWLLSNQARWGRLEGMETLLFSGCGEKIYLNEIRSKGRSYDEALLPELNRRLDQAEKPAIAFLHLMGAHFPFADQYPANRAVFPIGENDVPPGVETSDVEHRARVDSYDNCIAYTDRVLGRIVENLVQRRRPSFLVYFSDHGETPNSRCYRDFNSADLWEIPFVVWLSPEYRAAFPETVDEIEKMALRPHRSDQLLGLFQVLARVNVVEMLK